MFAYALAAFSCYCIVKPWLDKFDRNKEIGYRGSCIYEGKFGEFDVAIKRVLYGGDMDKDRVAKELKLLKESKAKSHHIIECYDHYFDDKAAILFICMERCNENLHTFIDEDQRRVSWNKYHKKNFLMEILYQVMKGLVHVHSLNIIHRDLKPHNILLLWKEEPTDPKSEVKVKLADFGLSKKANSSGCGSLSTERRAASGWAAQEIYDEENETVEPSCDVFTIGCVIYFVLTGHHPFGIRNSRLHNITIKEPGNCTKLYDEKSKCEGIPNGCMSGLIVKEMISHIPKQRPGARAVWESCIFLREKESCDFFSKVSKRIYVLKAYKSGTDQFKDNLRINLDEHSKEIFETKLLKDLELDNMDLSGYKDTTSDLIRALRNTMEHIKSTSELCEKFSLGASTSPTDPDILVVRYFNMKFPKLLFYTYNEVWKALAQSNSDDKQIFEGFFTRK